MAIAAHGCGWRCSAHIAPATSPSRLPTTSPPWSNTRSLLLQGARVGLPWVVAARAIMLFQRFRVGDRSDCELDGGFFPARVTSTSTAGTAVSRPSMEVRAELGLEDLLGVQGEVEGMLGGDWAQQVASMRTVEARSGLGLGCWTHSVLDGPAEPVLLQGSSSPSPDMGKGIWLRSRVVDASSMLRWLEYCVHCSEPVQQRACTGGIKHRRRARVMLAGLSGLELAVSIVLLGCVAGCGMPQHHAVGGCKART